MGSRVATHTIDELADSDVMRFRALHIPARLVYGAPLVPLPIRTCPVVLACVIPFAVCKRRCIQCVGFVETIFSVWNETCKYVLLN